MARTLLTASLHTLAVVTSITATRCQTSNHEAAVASFRDGKHTDALRQLAADPQTDERLDSLYLRARILAAHGDPKQAAEAVRAFSKLYERRLAEVLATTEFSGRSTTEPPNRTDSGTTGRTIMDNFEAVVARGASADPETRAHAMAALRKAISDLPQVVPGLVADAGLQRGVQDAIPLMTAKLLPPMERTKACISLARSADPAVAAFGKEMLSHLLIALLQEEDAKGHDEATNHDPTDSGNRVFETDEPIAMILSLLNELRTPKENIETLTWRAPTARTFRLLAATFERWAAELEAMEYAQGFRQAFDDYVTTALNLPAELRKRGATEKALASFRNSRHPYAATRVREELHEATSRRLASARELEGKGDARGAAEEYALIVAIDPTQLEATREAARLFESAGLTGMAARYLELLAMHDASELAEQSWARLQALWYEAREQLGELKRLRKTLPSDPARAAPGLLSLVERLMPALEGRQLDGIRQLIANGQLPVAAARLNDLLAAVETQPPVRPTVIQVSATPQIGHDFDLRDVGLRCSWMPPTAEEPGFWFAQELTDMQLWRNTIQNATIVVSNAANGSLMLSRDNADVLCSALTAREHAAGRLPADWIYALPTQAQLARMQAGGRMPNTRGLWLWTSESTGLDPSQKGRQLPYTWRPGPPPERRTRRTWVPEFDVGFLIVLTRAGR